MPLESNSDNEGIITYFRNSYEPCVCIKKNRYWKWERITDLSSEKFHKYRDKINDSLHDTFEKLRTLENQENTVVYEPHPLNMI